MGRQIPTIRVQSGVTQARLAAAVGMSFAQLQKYESAWNRVSASRLHKIAIPRELPVRQLFEGISGNKGWDYEIPSLLVDERITFIARAKWCRLVEDVAECPPTGDWEESVQFPIAKPIDQTGGR